MKYAIDETNRRRAKQHAYNVAHNIKPMTIIKGIYDLSERLTTSTAIAEEKADYRSVKKAIPRNELKHSLAELEREMKEAAKRLDFERAAELRDQVYELRGLLADIEKASPWKRAKMLSGEIDLNKL
jgi:excinuclease ABC subunit B